MTTSSAPFDLAALRRACGPVIAWYERFLAGHCTDVHELDEALAQLRRLPSMGGRLGKAVATLLSGGLQVSSDEVLVAFEHLRTAAGLRTPPVASVPPVGRTSSGRRRIEHPRLPGLG